MAGFSFELVGLAEMMNELSQLEASTRSRCEQAVTDATLDARDASLSLIPVDTGRLLSGQQVRPLGGSLLIMNELYNDVPYARWVCFGHHTRSGSWVAPQDFMTAPILVGQKSLEARLGNIFG